jgi:glycosyltransferase involved in cell wall biosynthesis
VSSSGARRLLLVSTNYAPEHAGIAPYATQIAEHWAAGGAEVHVLTGMPHYPAWRLDPAYAGVERVVEERAGVRVHRRGHVVPARQTALNRARFEASVLRGGRDEPEGMGRPDAVFAQMPSLAGGLLAARAAQRHGVPFVPVVQDLMGAAAAQSGIRGGGPAALVAGRVERHVLRQAVLVGVIHESFTPKVEAMGVPGERVRVVPNWSHIRRPSRSREEMRARLGWRPGQVVLLHSGNMGLKQGLEVLVETARSAPELRVVLMGDGNQREHLRALAGGLPNLDFMPPAADEEFADVLAAADVLAVTQRASVRDMSLPSKLTSYFAAGRPVLGSVAPDSGTALEIARSGAGVNVPPESAPAILTALAALTADPDRMAALAAAGPAYAEANLTPAAGLARIDALLTEALSLAPPPPPRPSAPPAADAGSPEAVAERTGTGAEPSASREQTAAPVPTVPPRPPAAPAVPPKPSVAPDTRTAAAPDGEQPRDEDAGDGTDDPAAAPHTAADDEKDTPAGSGAAVPAGSGSQGGTGAAEAAAGEKEGLGG